LLVIRLNSERRLAADSGLRYGPSISPVSGVMYRRDR
jgi:hypothetical protein